MKFNQTLYKLFLAALFFDTLFVSVIAISDQFAPSSIQVSFFLLLITNTTVFLAIVFLHNSFYYLFYTQFPYRRNLLTSFIYMWGLSVSIGVYYLTTEASVWIIPELITSFLEVMYISLVVLGIFVNYFFIFYDLLNKDHGPYIKLINRQFKNLKYTSVFAGISILYVLYETITKIGPWSDPTLALTINFLIIFGYGTSTFFRNKNMHLFFPQFHFYIFIYNRDNELLYFNSLIEDTVTELQGLPNFFSILQSFSNEIMSMGPKPISMQLDTSYIYFKWAEGFYSTVLTDKYHQLLETSLQKVHDSVSELLIEKKFELKIEDFYEVEDYMDDLIQDSFYFIRKRAQ